MATMTTPATNLSYVLLLVGGLNWLATGLRLVVDNAGDDKYNEPVPDLLSWGGETFQLIVYLAVGTAALALLSAAFLGYWVKGGDALITCA